MSLPSSLIASTTSAARPSNGSGRQAGNPLDTASCHQILQLSVLASTCLWRLGLAQRIALVADELAVEKPEGGWSSMHCLLLAEWAFNRKLFAEMLGLLPVPSGDGCRRRDAGLLEEGTTRSRVGEKPSGTRRSSGIQRPKRDEPDRERKTRPCTRAADRSILTIGQNGNSS